MIPEELAKYGATGIALGALILIGWLIKMFLDRQRCAEEEHQKFMTNIMRMNRDSYRDLKKSVDKSTKATSEMHDFLKNLNGKFKKAYKEKCEEANI